jgi:hypothetical protein
MSRARSPIEDLRLAIDCLPVRTRRAMLEGIRTNEIIVGAYADRAGGVCPMLAAHRCGGRTSFVSFAHAWDRFAGSRRARRATPRELRILEGQLEASLLVEDRLDLGVAICDHEALYTSGERARADERQARSAPEPRRDRWAWLRPGRRWADDERPCAAWSQSSRCARRPTKPRRSGTAALAPTGRSPTPAASGSLAVRGRGRAPSAGRAEPTSSIHVAPMHLLSARRTRTAGTTERRLP